MTNGANDVNDAPQVGPMNDDDLAVILAATESEDAPAQLTDCELGELLSGAQNDVLPGSNVGTSTEGHKGQ